MHLARELPMITRRRLIPLACLFFMVFGCAWQRIPPMPEYAPETPIPLKVGVQLASNQPSAYLGPGIINNWKEMRLFEGIVYPYRADDSVDAVMDLSINGGWKGSGAGKGFIVGLTLGLAGTVMGPSMTGTHDAQCVLNIRGNEAGRYAVQVSTEVEWGVFADTGEVSNKAEELQRRTLAIELAKKIRAERQQLVIQKEK